MGSLTPKSKNFTTVVVAITLVFGYSVLVRLGKRYSYTTVHFLREYRMAGGACLRPNVDVTDFPPNSMEPIELEFAHNVRFGMQFVVGKLF